jgi:hypothetical protein
MVGKSEGRRQDQKDLVMVGSEEDGPSIGSGDIIIWNGNMKLVV